MFERFYIWYVSRILALSEWLVTRKGWFKVLAYGVYVLVSILTLPITLLLDSINAVINLCNGVTISEMIHGTKNLFDKVTLYLLEVEAESEEEEP